MLEAYSPDSRLFTGAYGISGDGNHIIVEHHVDDVFKSTVHLVVAVDRTVVDAGAFLT